MLQDVLALSKQVGVIVVVIVRLGCHPVHNGRFKVFVATQAREVVKRAKLSYVVCVHVARCSGRSDARRVERRAIVFTRKGPILIHRRRAGGVLGGGGTTAGFH